MSDKNFLKLKRKHDELVGRVTTLEKEVSQLREIVIVFTDRRDREMQNIKSIIAEIKQVMCIWASELIKKQ